MKYPSDHPVNNFPKYIGLVDLLGCHFFFQTLFRVQPRSEAVEIKSGEKKSVKKVAEKKFEEKAAFCFPVFRRFSPSTFFVYFRCDRPLLTALRK